MLFKTVTMFIDYTKSYYCIIITRIVTITVKKIKSTLLAHYTYCFLLSFYLFKKFKETQALRVAAHKVSSKKKEIK